MIEAAQGSGKEYVPKEGSKVGELWKIHRGATEKEEASEEAELVEALEQAYNAAPLSPGSGIMRGMETHYGPYNRHETPYGFRELWQNLTLGIR